MFDDDRNMSRAAKFSLIALASLLCMGFILVGIYPYKPNSVIAWVVLYLLSLPMVFVFEWLGGRVFESGHTASMKNLSRLAVGIMTVLILLAVIYILFANAKTYLETW